MLIRRAIAATALTATMTLSLVRGEQRIAPPPAGKLYQGLYFDEPAAGRDPTEHDVTAENVARFEQTLGTKTAWIFFSNNW